MEVIFIERIDWVILIFYIVIVFLIGVLCSRNNSNKSDYFQGGRNIPWQIVGISVGMTMLSSGSFVGNVGWAYTDGLIVGITNIAIPLCVLFSTNTILPLIYKSKVTTIGEFLLLRFGAKTKTVVLLIWLTNALLLISGSIYTPSLVLDSVTSIDFQIWVIIIFVLAIGYTIIGGIKAVIFTDAIQGVVLLVGVLLGLIFAIEKIGLSFNQILLIAKQSDKVTTYIFEANRSNYNVYMGVLAGFICWVSYFGFNQEQVQRYTTARSTDDVKKTSIISTSIMIGVYWLCYILGIVLFVFYGRFNSTIDLSNSNNVLIDFLINYMPSGIKGLIIVAIFSSAMSSLDSILNSVTASFIKDIYEPYFSRGKEVTLKQSMLCTLAVGILAIIFVYCYLGDSTNSIMLTIGSLSAPLQGTLTGIMFVLLFCPRVNDLSMFLGTILGFSLAIGIKIFETHYNIHWMWGYVYSAVLVIFISYICSYLFKSEPEEINNIIPYTLSRKRFKISIDRYNMLTLLIWIVLIMTCICIQTI